MPFYGRLCVAYLLLFSIIFLKRILGRPDLNVNLMLYALFFYTVYDFLLEYVSIDLDKRYFWHAL
jgi:hypothetical protein